MVAATEEARTNPLLVFHTVAYSSFLCESCFWLGISRPARFLNSKRSKGYGRSEALHSQTTRNPAGVYLSAMDYISPIPCFYKSIYHQGLVECLLLDQLHTR